MWNQYIYELQERQRKRKLAERFSGLEQKELNELKLIKENDPQYVRQLSSEEAEIEGEEIEEEKDEKDEEECDAEDNIIENLSSTNQIEHCDVLEEEEAEINAMNKKNKRKKKYLCLNKLLTEIY